MKKKNYITLFCLLYIVSFNHAQPLKNILQRLDAGKYISYTDILYARFYTVEHTDTIRSYISFIPSEQQTNGYYSLVNRQQIYKYDGNKLFSLDLRDSTYKISKEAITGQNTRTLLYWAKNIRSFLSTPAMIKQLPDTSLNNKSYEHVRVTVADSMSKGEHIYTIYEFFVDPKSYLPAIIRCNMRGISDNGLVIEFMEEHLYSDYVFDAKGFPDLSLVEVPAYFKPSLDETAPGLLAPGKKVPDVALYDLSGKAASLDKLQGKIVLLSFTATNCPHSVSAAQMLIRLHNKYKTGSFAIVSVYPFDEKETIARFNKRFNVYYSSYTAQKDVDKEFPYSEFPTFYLVDEDGLVVDSYKGFYNELEGQLIKKINSLKR